MGKLIPIEIKYSASVHKYWGKGIMRFREAFPLKEISSGFIISLYPEIYEVERNVWNIPVYIFF